MNCASETGIEARDASDCCRRPGRRSFRDPWDGTCHRCDGM